MDGSHTTNNYRVVDKNKLFEEDIWIEGSMGYPSGDVELTFASVGVALSRTCMSSVFRHNEGLGLHEIT